MSADELLNTRRQDVAKHWTLKRRGFERLTSSEVLSRHPLAR